MAPRKSKLLPPESIRLDPDVKAFLAAEAAAEDRPVQYVIRRVLREYVERRRREEASGPPPKA
jgi:predicted transcriptional regulator